VLDEPGVNKVVRLKGVSWRRRAKRCRRNAGAFFVVVEPFVNQDKAGVLSVAMKVLSGVGAR